MMVAMRIGVMVGFSATGARSAGAVDLAAQVELAVRAEQVGAQVCFVSEAYGYDAATPLAWIAARTSTMELGSAVLQIPGRTPAMAAMTAATLDALSGGRFLLGLGISGPQVSDGWHGVAFDRPLARTHAYVAAVRAGLAREQLRVDAPGLHVPATPGEYRPMRLAVRPRRADLPILLAALGDRNLELTGEVADGWLAVWAVPEQLARPLARIEAGRVRSGRSGSFDVVALVPAALGADVQACADRLRPLAALYLGGMGTVTQNFYARQAERLGYADATRVVGEHFRAGRLREAADAVPFEFLDATCLLGDEARVAGRLAAFAEAGVTTLAVAPMAGDTEQRLREVGTVVRLAGEAGL